MGKQLSLLVFILSVFVLIQSHDGAFAQSDIEAVPQQTVSFEGWLSVNYGDPAPGSAQPGVVRVMLHPVSGESIQLDVPVNMVQTFHGRFVHVTGMPLDQEAAGLRQQVAPEATLVLQVDDIQVVESAEIEQPAAVSGSQPWVNILCKFADKTDEPRTPSNVNSLFSSTEPGLNHYWQALSYNAININGTQTVSQWRTLPEPRSFYVYEDENQQEVVDLSAIADDCASAHDADVFFPNFVGVNIVINDAIGCCAWGGGYYFSNDNTFRFYRTTWLPPWAVNHDVIAHEMGHGFGFPHSTGPADNPPSGLSIYVSQWDVMSSAWGTCQVSSQNYGCIAPGTITYNLYSAGWINNNERVVVSPGMMQTITLDSTAAPTGQNPLMIQIPIDGSTSRYYTVEARNQDGYDQNIPGQAVIIHDVSLSRTGNGGPSYVVDAADGNNNVNDAGAMWLPGETYIDDDNGIEIAVLSRSGDQFTINVRNRYTLPQDVDGDGTITPTDAIYVINRLGQIVTVDNMAADVDDNGVIDADDAWSVILNLGITQ